MKKAGVITFLLSVTVAFAMCRKAQPYPEEMKDERLSGGQNTVFDIGSGAFGHALPGLEGFDEHVHGKGDVVFSAAFVTAPSKVNPGLGPAYNNVSCVSCHHNDGRGIPSTGATQSALLVRISQPGMDAHGGALAVPGYGTQLQDKSIYGYLPECKIDFTYTEKEYSFPDGEKYYTYTPTYQCTNLYTPINGTYMLSPRLAPAVFGLGLLEAIPEGDIVAASDEFDMNHDGISGKPNYVWDPATNARQLGRFGLKANTASLLAQVAAAFNNDMGITSSIFPLETVHGQLQEDKIKDDPELSDSLLNAVKFYMQSLAVPARRNVNDPTVKRGKQLFVSLSCVSCHKQTYTTGVDVTFRAISNQEIHPYTDMLLHDMGPGLADNRPDFLADGQEWRTTPLWGLGLVAKVNFPGYYLHDGRARTITEAIMWHGGEAQKSKDAFANLSKEDRAAVLKFLESL